MTMRPFKDAFPFSRFMPFGVVVLIVMTASAQGAKTGPAPLRLSLELARVVDEHSRVEEQFMMTVENTGDTDYPLPTELERLWNVTLYRSGARDPEPLTWSTQGVGPASLEKGKKWMMSAKWQFPTSPVPGSYHFEAQFLPTGDTRTADFAIQAPTDREILFTSKLMGYYRLPDQQSFSRSPSDPGCPIPDLHQLESPDPKDFSRDALVFIKQFKKRAPSTVLLGTGDNFAPNYFSRVLTGATKVTGVASPPEKELYSWDGSRWLWYEDVERLSPHTNIHLRQGTATIPTDNVGCFLSYVRYDAVTPGKHDFYYGPEHLREIARFMASLPKKDETGRDTEFWPVQMLGANMMIKTNWAGDHASIPDSGKRPLPFTTKYVQVPAPPGSTPVPYRSLEITDFTEGGFAFPWMQFVRVNATGTWQQADLKRLLEVYLCEAEPDDADDFLNHRGFCNNQQVLSINSGATDAAEVDSGPGSLVYALPGPSVLRPGRNYAVCLPAPEITVDHRSDPDARRAKPYCFRFSVYNPFFQFPNWNDKDHNDPTGRYKNPHLWDLKEADGKTPVLIFGIVDQQLQEHVGGDNFAWRTVRGTPAAARRDDRYSTRLVIADPVRTLIQLEDYFEEEYEREHPTKAFDGIRVLLAQMPPEAVKQLAEHLPRCLRFDVIVSAADDGLATPNQILQYRPSIIPEDGRCRARVGSSGLKMKSKRVVNGALAIPSTFLAVPPSHEQPPRLPVLSEPAEQNSRFSQVRRLRITADSRSYVTLTLDGDPIPVRVPDPASLAGLANTFWLGVCRALYGATACTLGTSGLATTSTSSTGAPTVLWDDSIKQAALQQLALWSIRKKYGTNIAFLQQRDFYPRGLEDYLSEHCSVIKDLDGKVRCDPNSHLTLDAQEILDRILWKGDYVHVKSVQGSVLKSVIKQSEQFNRNEKTAYLSISESGRPLLKLGIQPDEKNGGDYLINNKPLDPSTLYTVTTSDYISLGDTGYPDLANPPVGNPPIPASGSETIFTISGVTCEVLTSPPASLANTGCNVTLNPDHYYDELVNQTPDDIRKGNTSWHKFYAWSYLHGSLGQPAPNARLRAPAGPDDVVRQMQRRLDSEKNWDFLLDKLSLGFSGLTHTDSEEILSRKFSGVQNAQVNAKHSHSWDWDANSKFTLFHRKHDLFVSEGMQYSSSFTAQSSGPRTESQSRNQFALDGGTYWHPWSSDKQLPQVSSVFAGHFETQVANPLTNISLSPLPPLIFKQGRTRLLLGRTGLRFQDRKSFVEAGLEGGATLNAIQEFRVLTAAGGPLVTCTLQASQSLSKCLNTFNQNNPQTLITSQSKVSVVRKVQQRYGAYWNMGLAVPINPTISYNFQESSDYFFNTSGDNSADTRYRHQLVNSLKFLVFPNLSFEPTYTIFLYENKVDHHSLVQQQYTVKVNYSFDWSNWHESTQQLRYKK
jgi:hypothetical protein